MRFYMMMKPLNLTFQRIEIGLLGMKGEPIVTPNLSSILGYFFLSYRANLTAYTNKDLSTPELLAAEAISSASSVAR